MALAPVRSRLTSLMESTVDDEFHHSNWRYHAVRPQAILPAYIARGYVESDCSDGCRNLCRWAGLGDDPAGVDYAPFGNSSSIYFHLHHAPLSQVEPGDMFTFGYSTGEHHVSMAFNADPDPLVWNMGTQGQPVFRRLSQEAAAHHGMTVTLCKLPVPDPPPTPQDKLRAHTDFYSWVAWKLGEGPWKHYGKAAKAVRPNVPWVISPSWWKRYATFLLNRKKPRG